MKRKTIHAFLEIMMIISLVLGITHLYFEYITIEALTNSTKSNSQRIDRLEKETR
jgi:hypothetical protein